MHRRLDRRLGACYRTQPEHGKHCGEVGFAAHTGRRVARVLAVPRSQPSNGQIGRVLPLMYAVVA